MQKPEALVHNSSFGSLDLKPGTKAQITECYIDAQFKPRPTLITANNSDLLIQNSHFGNFINENGSTILHGFNNSRIITNHSSLTNGSSSKGVLIVQNTSSLNIANSIISQNVANASGYSVVTLQEGVDALIHNTIIRNNSAENGGFIKANDQCRVQLTNCRFFMNEVRSKFGSGGTVYVEDQGNFL